MDDWTPTHRLALGAWWAAGLGLLAGVFETAGLAATHSAPLGLAGFALLGALTVLSTAALGALSGLLLGGFFHVAARGGHPPDKFAVHLGAVGAVLCGWYLYPEIPRILAEGRPVVALLIALMPALSAMVVYFNARYWLRRLHAGRDVGVGWMPAVAAVVTLLIGGIAGLWSARDTGGRGALEGDPNVLIITVDGLRADALPPLSTRPLPHLKALVDGGISYEQAIAPITYVRPANAAVLTGRHPLRLAMASPEQPLGRRYTTLGELFEAEGYATGAFVSSAAVQRASGLHQGFRTWDDTLGPLGLGLERTTVLGPLLRAAGLVRVRSDNETTSRAVQWLDDHSAVPFFGWVHLASPSLARPDSYAEAVAALDEQVGRLLGQLETAGLQDSTFVAVVGTHGRLLGTHGAVGTPGIWDEVVRVPLVVRAPGVASRMSRVPQQVRTYDVFPAVLAWARFDEQEEAEGIDLLGYATGRREKGLWISLIGRDGPQDVLGLRMNGVKYIKTLDGHEQLYDLQRDPGESDNLIERQEQTAAGARLQMMGEEASYKSLMGVE